MRLLIPMFEIAICMNLLLAVSLILAKTILFIQKPIYRLYLARLLFLSCILSPVAVHYINLPQKNIFAHIMPSYVVKNPSYQSIKDIIDENIVESSIVTSSTSKLDLSYLYLALFILFVSGFFYRIYKIVKDINKTKSIIDTAQTYKKYGKITIKISDQCFIPFSVRFIQAAYIVLPVSILHSSINTNIAIAHEGQHHRHGDCFWAYLLEFTSTIFWFNPFLIYWHRLFHELQELACDEALINKNKVSAQEYGYCLFDITKTASKYTLHHILVTQIVSGNKNENSFITKRICMLSEYKNYPISKTILSSILLISVILILGPLTTAYAAKTFNLNNANDELNSIDISSIDSKIQDIAAKEIANAVNNSNAKSGAIVIADAHTGKIVAFAETNTTGENHSWASRVFNPASTIKPFIAAAAIDSGVASESTVYDCRGSYQIYGKQFNNDNSKIGNLSLADAMTNSINVCMIKAAQETGSAKTRQVLSRFGFDMNAAWNKNNSDALNLSNTAIGSSIPVTLATLTNAYMILANKGHSISTHAGNVISIKTANSLTHLLEKVVNEGTGKQAAIANVLVAGKTGTLSNETHTSTLALFAGYVPANSPRYVSIVVVENAKINDSLSKANGGNIAAPVFHHALEKVLLLSK